MKIKKIVKYFNEGAEQGEHKGYYYYINEDCQKIDLSIFDKFDLILTDPPYEISKENNFSTMKNPRIGIDFGQWDKNFNLEWVKKLNEITTNNASVIIFIGLRQLSKYIELMELNNFIFKDLIRWVKLNPMPRNRDRRYIFDAEYALLFVKKKSNWTFNRVPEVPYLRPEFKTSIVSTKDRIHPTQKHLELLKELIKIHSNKNDTILDLYMGSGSTGIACLQLQRNFVGIEKDRNYYEEALNWFVKDLNNE